MWLLLLLVLTACSGVQGVPMSPRAPVFSPVEDAPLTIGHSGTAPPAPKPRGTDARVLPPTREPGIWASGAGHGDAPSDLAPSILGIPLPVAWPHDEHASAIPAICAAEFADALEASEFKGYLGILTEAQRRCAVSIWYLRCATQRAAVFESDSASEKTRSTANAAKHLAQRAKDEACDGVTFAPPENHAVNSVLVKWLSRGAR